MGILHMGQLKKQNLTPTTDHLGNQNSPQLDLGACGVVPTAIHEVGIRARMCDGRLKCDKIMPLLMLYYLATHNGHFIKETLGAIMMAGCRLNIRQEQPPIQVYPLCPRLFKVRG